MSNVIIVELPRLILTTPPHALRTLLGARPTPGPEAQPGMNLSYQEDEHARSCRAEMRCEWLSKCKREQSGIVRAVSPV